MCRDNPKSAVDASERAKIVDNSIKNSLSSLDKTIKNLDSKIKAVKGSFQFKS